MTLIVGLQGNDGLVLAGDSRGTYGDPRGITAQNDTMLKVYGVSKHVGVLVAGAGEVAAMVMESFKTKVSPSDGVTRVTNALREHCRQQYKDWFSAFALQANPPTGKPVRPDLSFIIGGYEIVSQGKLGAQALRSLNSQLD